MTKDKELIERLALEVSTTIAAEEIGCPEPEVVDDMDDTDKSMMIKFATRFLSAYLAERGKEAFAFTGIEEGKRVLSMREDFYGAEGITSIQPLFLAPQIPEGYALVPIEPTEAMLDCFIGATDARGRFESMLDAAAGVQP